MGRPGAEPDHRDARPNDRAAGARADRHRAVRLDSVPGPLPPGRARWSGSIPQVGLPAPENRPAAVTHAHEIPRTWPGTRLQVEDHLLEGSEGQVRPPLRRRHLLGGQPGSGPLIGADHDEVVEVIEGDDRAGVLLTCEHASNRLPRRGRGPRDPLARRHALGVRLGIADVTRALAHAIGAPAVLARFSRLLCDANRPTDAETLFRTVADGHRCG